MLKKGGRLFGFDRQLGLGVEAGYKAFMERGGRLDAGSVPNLSLRGGNLQLLKDGIWQNISQAEVVLPENLKSFIVKHVKLVDDRLAAMQYAVLRVDPHVGQKVQSVDLWGFFRGDRAPVRGHAPVEHKLVFGKKGYAAKVEGHKAQVKTQFLKRRGVVAQLLWVTQVASSTDPIPLKHELFIYKKGTDWQELLSQNDQTYDHLPFEEVWAKCIKERKQSNTRTAVVQVAHFLKCAGKGGRNVRRCLKYWTSKRCGLGLQMKEHFWRQPCMAGCGAGGSRKPWVASESTLRKLFPLLMS